MSEKKFANMHYPGMKANPNEGEKNIDEATLWYFKEQIEEIGLDAQKRLLFRSVLVLGASPLAVRIVQRLSRVGIGRVGLFGVSELNGAHGAIKEDADSFNQKYANKAALKWVLEWTKKNTPWVELETFSGTSIDRKFEDIVRGFDWVVATSEDAETHQALILARTHKKEVVTAEDSQATSGTKPSSDYSKLELAACAVAQSVFNAAVCNQQD